MSAVQPKFRREPAEQRRDALIEATLTLIATNGPGMATSRAIAAEARVTQGLIRHYFGSKEELIAAAFERHMSRITEATTLVAISARGTALDRLEAFVIASLTPPVVNPRATGIWAGFMYMVQHNPRIKETHKRTYIAYRNQLEALIATALEEAGKSVPKDKLLRYAIAGNAVIDGLWLVGSVLPDCFSGIDLPETGLASVGAILGLELGAKS